MSATAGRGPRTGAGGDASFGAAGRPGTVRIRVWDLPTRLFHWSLAVCVAGSIVSANLGGNALAWHFRFGYAILALLLFRVAWGFVGPRYARFASFPPNPGAALRHLLAQPAYAPGHSPLGALSVYAMLVVLAVQAVTGLFANDEILWEGPLRNTVSNATSDWLTALHLSNRWLLIGLVALHLAAIAWHALVRRRRLVRAMVVGDAEFDTRSTAGGSPRPATDDGPVRARAALLLAAAAALVWMVVTQAA